MITSAGLTIEQILASDDRPVRFVECPEWGGRLYYRPMTGADRGLLEERRDRAESDADLRMWIFSTGHCDENGERVEWSPRQIAQLGDKNGEVIERVATAILAAGGTVEEQEKNLPADQSDYSGSTSVLPTESPSASSSD